MNPSLTPKDAISGWVGGRSLSKCSSDCSPSQIWENSFIETGTKVSKGNDPAQWFAGRKVECANRVQRGGKRQEAHI